MRAIFMLFSFSRTCLYSIIDIFQSIHLRGWAPPLPIKCKSDLYVYLDNIPLVCLFKVTADGPMRSGRTKCRKYGSPSQAPLTVKSMNLCSAEQYERVMKCPGVNHCGWGFTYFVSTVKCMSEKPFAQCLETRKVINKFQIRNLCSFFALFHFFLHL